MAVAKYLRISQEDGQGGESNSIQNQRALLDSYIKGHGELAEESAVEYIDDGYSGTNFYRPSLQKLLGDAEKGGIQCIIVKDFSRFARNYILLGYYLERVFPFMGIRFISVNDRYDSRFAPGNSGLERSFQGLLYDLYSKDLSRKVLAAKNMMRLEGRPLGGGCPFGYKKELGNNRRYCLDQDAAEVVRKIFRLAKEGKKDREIAWELNKEKIATPRARAIVKKIGGKENKIEKIWDAGMEGTHLWDAGMGTYLWDAGKVASILRDERYTGTFISGRYQSRQFASKQCKRRPQEQWIKVPFAHEAIISADEFTQVQVQMQRRRQRTTAAKATQTHIWHGIVYCGVCKRALYHKKAKNTYFYCKTSRIDPYCTCSKETLREKALEEALQEVIGKYIALGRGWGEETPGKAGKARREQNEEKKAWEREMVKRAVLYEQYQKGRLSWSAYCKEKEKIAAEAEEKTRHRETHSFGVDGMPARGYRTKKETEAKNRETQRDGELGKETGQKPEWQCPRCFIHKLSAWGQRRIEINFTFQEVWNAGGKWFQRS